MRRLSAFSLATCAALLATSCGILGEPEVPTVDQLRSKDHLAEQVESSGTYIADSGFRPDPNGFSFPNYGASTSTESVANIGATELVELFGDDVCLTGTGTACRLSSPATSWLQMINNGASGGHCEGMAAMSQLLYTGAQTPTDFGADSTFGLPFTDNTTLQRQIARWFATQYTTPTSQDEIFESPNDILDTLIEELPKGTTAENSYTMGIYQPNMSGGHAITPYAVEDRGDGIYWILVYDNNYPGQERAVAVDREENVWSYLASTRPDLDAVVYVGTDETDTLTLTPTSSRLQLQECPFCAGELDGEVESEGTNQFILTGPGSEQADTDFFITDAADQRLGRVSGTPVKEISDGSLDFPRFGINDAPVPFITAPAALDTTVTITSGQESTDMDFSMIGSGYDVLIDGINAPAGSQTEVTLDSDGTRVTYSQVPRTGPVVSLGAADDDGYQFDLSVDLEEFAAENPRVSFVGDEDTDTMLIGSPNVSGTYSILFDVYAPDDSLRVLRIASFTLEQGNALQVELPGNGEVFASIVDGDGEKVRDVEVVDETLQVPRQLG